LANPNVFAQFAQPYRSFEDYSQQYEQLNNQRLMGQNMQQQNAIRAAAMADAERQRAAQTASANAIARLSSEAGGNEDAYISGLQRAGYYDEALKLQKARGDIAKTQGETKAKTQETQRKAYEFMIQGLQAAPDPQTAAAMVRGSVGNTGMTMQEAEAFARTIPLDQQAYQQWRPTALRAILAAKDQLPKIETRNLGGTTDTIATDIFGGGSRVVNSARNTQSPDSVASNATTMRGQNMTDARARERLDIDRGAATADAGGPGQAALVKQLGKPPKDYRWKADGTAEAIPGGPADIKAGELGAKREKSQQAAMAQADRIISTVDSALEKIGYTTAGPGAAVAAVPGTTARNLRSELETIKANLGFAELQAMREASPTGGALGAIAVQELTALQSTIASLDQGQSPAQLDKSLKKIRGHLQKLKEVNGGSTGGATGSFDLKPGTDLGDGFRVK
jgi:hypothetical protein